MDASIAAPSAVGLSALYFAYQVGSEGMEFEAAVRAMVLVLLGVSVLLGTVKALQGDPLSMLLGEVAATGGLGVVAAVAGALFGFAVGKAQRPAR